MINGVAKEIVGARLVEPKDVEPVRGERTPGRTWTTFDVDADAAGDGTVSIECSSSDVEVLSLGDAITEYPDEVRQVFFTELDPAANRLAAYHAHRLDDAVFLYIPKNTVVDEPVTVTTTAKNGFFPHHVLVYAADGSAAQIVERNTGSADCDSSFTEVYVGENANVSYTKINDLGQGRGYSDNAAHVASEGTINWLMLSTGSELYRNSILTRLAGSRSTLQYDLGFLAADTQHMDHTAHVIHDGDNTRCNMDSRGVVMEQARVIYKGVQQVENTTTGTKSFQDEKTILIGNECEADTTPQLQIENNEVEATHAATTGHIDEEDLFYMQSRGLNAAQAQKEIVTGMFDDLIGANGAGRDVFHRKIQKHLQ